MDGQTGWEHYIANLPIYSDVTRFLGQAAMTYSPTAGVAGHGRGAVDYYRPLHDFAADANYRSLVPATMVPAKAARRSIDEFSFPIIAGGLADIRRNGGFGAIGDHSEQSGLSSHWEIWTYATALSPMDALRVATIEGARFHGLDADVGSIKVGKLADFVILNSNPLDDIHNTLDIMMVAQGGRLYDHRANELWPTRSPYGPLPWASVPTAVTGADVQEPHGN